MSSTTKLLTFFLLSYCTYLLISRISRHYDLINALMEPETIIDDDTNGEHCDVFGRPYDKVTNIYDELEPEENFSGLYTREYIGIDKEFYTSCDFSECEIIDAYHMVPGDLYKKWAKRDRQKHLTNSPVNSRLTPAN